MQRADTLESLIRFLSEHDSPIPLRLWCELAVSLAKHDRDYEAVRTYETLLTQCE
jgi:hypothetical protein